MTKQVAIADGVFIYNGDCRDVMAQLEPESIDAIVSDPPYGLEFMGKGWDHGVPGAEFWAEALRVLKPGGHLLAFGGTRTFHRLAVAIEDAGFEIRDTLSWMYGSGFPKSLNVAKAIDKADPPPEWEGWGTALKPSWEPIVMARKPLTKPGVRPGTTKKATVAETVTKHGTGALNIDATRIAANGENLGGGAETVTRRDQKSIDTEEGTSDAWARPWMDDPEAQERHAATVRANVEKAEALGRWPANTLLSHDEGCEVVGTRKVKTGTAVQRNGGGQAIFGGIAGGENTMGARDDATFADADGTETIAAWECMEGCPVRLLDEQSGVLSSGGTPPRRPGDSEGSRTAYGKFAGQEAPEGIGRSSGGASRFYYSSKTSKGERNAGLPEGKKNDHPTVKPISVMAWLVKLVTPPDGIVMDPFMGSGSTGIAAVQEGFRFIGIDLEAPYCNIAWHRLKHAVASKEGSNE